MAICRYRPWATKVATQEVHQSVHYNRLYVTFVLSVLHELVDQDFVLISNFVILRCKLAHHALKIPHSLLEVRCITCVTIKLLLIRLVVKGVMLIHQRLKLLVHHPLEGLYFPVVMEFLMCQSNVATSSCLLLLLLLTSNHKLRWGQGHRSIL